MSWEQELVDAQVSVNRCVFEINRPGQRKGTRAKYREQYILQQAVEAIRSLSVVAIALAAKKEKK